MLRMLAVLITERGLGGDSADLERRLVAVCGGTFAARHRRAPAGGAAGPAGRRRGRRAVRSPARLARLLIHAWPDRVAMARGERGRFCLVQRARRDARRCRSARRRKIPRRRRFAGQGAERPHRLGRGDFGRRTSARRSASASRNGRRRCSTWRSAPCAFAKPSGLGAIVLAERLLPAPSWSGCRSRDHRCGARARAVAAAMGQGGRNAAPSAGLAASRTRRALARHVGRGADRFAGRLAAAVPVGRRRPSRASIRAHCMPA